MKPVRPLFRRRIFAVSAFNRRRSLEVSGKLKMFAAAEGYQRLQYCLFGSHHA
jgi:hypothetical protein